MEIDDYIVADDRQLIRLVLGGDTVAFDYLFARYRESIYRLLLQRLGGNSVDADDLLQETFIKVFLNMRRYNEAYTFGQWVYTIAHNTLVDFTRRRQSDISIDEKFTAPPTSTPNPEENIIAAQRMAQIDHYIGQLPPPYRTLFILRFIDEYSYDEIAERLDIPLGTVKTRIFRARERMCALIQADDNAAK